MALDPDWVSAWGAILQAAAAGAAIFYSIKLARESAEREKAAEAASLEREKRASEIAEQRAIAAEQRHEELIIAAHNEAHNRPIEFILETLRRVIRRAGEVRGANQKSVGCEIDWSVKQCGTGELIEVLGTASTHADPKVKQLCKNLVHDIKETIGFGPKTDPVPFNRALNAMLAARDELEKLKKGNKGSSNPNTSVESSRCSSPNPSLNGPTS